MSNTKVLYVTKTTDDINDPKTLRGAINVANTGQTYDLYLIKLNKGLSKKTIKLVNGEISVEVNIRIRSNVKVTIQNTVANQRVFNVDTRVTRFEIIGSSCGVITIRDGLTTLDGGAIYFSNPLGQLVLKHVKLTNNSAANGGAIYSLGQTTLSHTDLEHNKATTSGGALWSNAATSLYNSNVKHNQITVINNSALGGGLYVTNGNFVLKDTCVTDNNIAKSDTEGGRAGAIYITDGNLYLINSHIDKNTAFASAAIFQGVGDIFVQKSTINHNKSYTTALATGGGGITINFGNVYLEDSEISHNKTKGMYSGGIVSLAGNVTVKGSQLCGNINRGPGGAIACNFYSIVTVQDSKILNNSGSSLGGAIVNFSGPEGAINIIDSQIDNNVLTNYQTIAQTIEAFLNVIVGQALAANPPANVQTIINDNAVLLDTVIKPALSLLFPLDHLIAGGAVSGLLNCPVNIINSKFSKNLAAKIEQVQINPLIYAVGGALFFPFNPVELQASDLKANTATGSAGGAYFGGGSRVFNSNIHRNKALNKQTYPLFGAGVNSGGGLFIAETANTQIIESEITKNKASAQGGGIYSTGAVVLVQTNVKDNSPNNIVKS